MQRTLSDPKDSWVEYERLFEYGTKGFLNHFRRFLREKNNWDISNDVLVAHIKTFEEVLITVSI